jgi:chromosomal replication initiation ATPase DnaA
MTSLPAQLVLDLPHRPALGAEDFLVSKSNQAAVTMIDYWPEWPYWAVIMSGPPRSGKSHLANVWRRKSGAERILASAVSEKDIATFKSVRALLIEDLHAGIADERALFYLLNLAREHRLSMLLTSCVAPGELKVGLRDLRSRLRSLPLVTIEAPDEALLKAVLVKHFADRQLPVEPHVVNHIALHIERSMEAAASVVSEIDRLALAQHCKVTRSLARQALARIGGNEA